MVFPEPATRTDFFISYAQADRAWAEWIAWVLEEAGFTAKLQAWDFHPGSNFVLAMQRSSVDAQRILAVLSPDYLQSAFGMAEWAAAFAQDPSGEKGKLLPVRVREVSPGGLLTPSVYIDLVNLSEAEAREHLMAALSRERAKPTTKPPYPGLARPCFPGDPDKAVARLDDLPLDEVPAPGPLPPGSRMPLSVNPLFVARREELRTLAHTLKVGDTAAIGQVEIAAATGLGGIGKTQLASELAHRYGRFFTGGVFWLSFADPAGVPLEVASCARGLGVPIEGLDLEQQVQNVREAWQSTLPRLLVFDNCEDEELLARWRPPSGGARVLVTSRRARWSSTLGVRTLPLGVLERAASIELLRRFRPDVPEGDAALGEIAEELGDLPLALHLAGSFLARYALTRFGQPGAYLERLRQEDLLGHPSLQGRGAELSPTTHEAHIARTFALSYERLRPEEASDALARSLLTRAAHFAPGEPIPRTVLLLALSLDESDMDAALAAEDALALLIDLGLLEIQEEETLATHRLVASFVRSLPEGVEARSSVEALLLSLASHLFKEGHGEPLQFLQPHLRAVTEAALHREDMIAERLCSLFGNYLQTFGDFSGARRYLERALAICEKVAGPEHPDTASSLSNLGQFLCRLGEVEAARVHFERALAIDDQAPFFLNNMGTLLQEKGDLAAARRYHEQALAIREKEMGSEHSDTAQSLNNLGFVLKDEGDFGGALQCFERALAIREKVLPADHPDLARSLSNVGALLCEQGAWERARPFFERALAIREKVLSPNHPDLAWSLNNAGSILSSAGDLTGARTHYERAFAILEKSLGLQHPNTARSLYALGSLLSDIGDSAGARQCYERALAIQERVCGPEHPDSIRTLQGLGRLLLEANDLAAAHPLLERVLAFAERHYGPDHLKLAEGLTNLGTLHLLQGERNTARPFLERALAVYEIQLGPDHPNTAIARRNLEACIGWQPALSKQKKRWAGRRASKNH